MGQAKQKGTFEERKKQAIARVEYEEEQREIQRKLREQSMTVEEKRQRSRVAKRMAVLYGMAALLGYDKN